MNDLFMTGAIPAILLASAITYGLRLGGLLLAGRLPQQGGARRFLDALPGTILVALVVPGALASGWEGVAGLAVCLGIYRLSGSLLLTMAGGIGWVAICRYVAAVLFAL